ncbi:MAG: RES family NAD+ phosphorylase [Solirubrobacteraceae bacterium]
MTPIRPAVPRATECDPLIETIAAGTTLIRLYPRSRGPLGFNPAATPGRFRPVLDDRGSVVPTAYLATDVETAISEGVLRGVSRLADRGDTRRLYRFELDELEVVAISVRRPLRVVRLHGAGLSRLEVLREHVIDTPESDYPYTALWAKALYGTRTRPHGLCWTSRQSDSGRALMLWRTRLSSGALDADGPPLALDRDPGLDLVRGLCADAGVDFEG